MTLRTMKFEVENYMDPNPYQIGSWIQIRNTMINVNINMNVFA